MPDSTPPEPVLALRPIDARKTEEPTTKGSRGQKRIPDRVRGRKIGRPTGYRPAYIDQAFKFCLLGLDDRRIAELLGTSRAGLDRWKRAYPRFREAFERGRDRADAAVAGALYKRAIGYSHPAEKPPQFEPGRQPDLGGWHGCHSPFELLGAGITGPFSSCSGSRYRA